MENSIVNQKTKSSNIEAFIFLGILLFGFSYVANIMGAGIMFSVMMNTAHDLLIKYGIFYYGTCCFSRSFKCIIIRIWSYCFN